MYREFIDKTAHSKNWNPIRSLILSWGTVYSKNLAEFTKEEIMAMCPKMWWKPVYLGGIMGQAYGAPLGKDCEVEKIMRFLKGIGMSEEI